MTLPRYGLLTKPQVLLLKVDILLHAEYLLQLMKQQIDELLAQDQDLQAFLTWVSQKSCAVTADYKPVTVRAFYFDLALARILVLVGGTLDLARALNRSFTCNLERTLALDLALDRALALDVIIDRTPAPNLVFELVLDRALAHARTLDPQLERALQQLKEQVPDRGKDGNRFKPWWEANGEAWTEQLRAVIIEYRHLGHNWQFSNQQRDTLKQYYDANQVLVNYLNSDCYMTRTVREEIEKTLLLPVAEISLR